MTDKNIVLTGFMGCGKSLTSIKLAKFMMREVISTDDLIIKMEGQSIEEIFERSGEDCFRKLEMDAVKKASEKKNVIIDCGGGVVLDAKNVEHLKKNGIIFYLSASPETIYNNIKSKQDRPLLNVQNPQLKIRELLDTRRPYYEQADVTINADNRTVDQMAEDILGALKGE